eukprot:gnl/MRDRNA2_/MRDRNA2_82755_c0_seq1.p1 gnl/MRDRNA2_/MRDRNA2_82755_c0~~gnl/MRDRNA2_/MRDRNA2_82755_c0_seq1.p1  ORF type:complete len:420 (+),score=59.50 gnl/MRDRNA2_/MRDRNA2_82755_c0_seq1:52-1311(+)
MGALLALGEAEEVSIAACLGTCLGSCAAGLCARLLNSGQVSTAEIARQVLFWLQASAAMIDIWFSRAHAEWWFSFLPCRWASGFGICTCGQDDLCWSHQSVFRFGFAQMVLFSIMLVFSACGCGASAERGKFVGKFLMVPLLAAALIPTPNELCSKISEIVKFLSAIFVVAQTTVLIDIAYTWNETWHKNALDSQRSKMHATGKEWYVAIVIAAVALIIVAVAEVLYCLTLYETLLARLLMMSTLLCSFALLVLSITEWCEHGSLLTSAMMMSYFVWLATRASASAPDDSILKQSTSDSTTPWFGIALGLFCLAVSTQKTHPDVFHVASQDVVPESYRRMEATSVPESASPQPSPGFTGHCLLNLSAAAHWITLLTSQPDWICFSIWAAALAVSILLYFWTLVAPKIFPDREFGYALHH